MKKLMLTTLRRCKTVVSFKNFHKNSFKLGTYKIRKFNQELKYLSQIRVMLLKILKLTTISI